MLIRLLAIFAFALLTVLAPTTTLADDTTTATDTPAATGSLLGPSSLGTGSGGSTTDSTSLQPAGQSPLQSTTSDATGLTAPNGSPLQAPASSNGTLRVVMGDADGSPVQVANTSSGPSLGAWLALSVLFGLVVTVLSLYYQRLGTVFSPLKKLGLPRKRASK